MNEQNNIPKHWNAVKVSEIGNLIRGVNYKKEEATNSPIENYLPILRGNNIDGILNFNDLVYVKRKNIAEEQLIQKGDIVFAMSSGSKHLVGKSAKALTNFNGGFGAFCGVFRTNKEANKDFVAYFFQSPYYKKTISEISKGTNINNLKREHILDLDFPSPPLPEQLAIVSKIEELLSDLENGKQQLQTAQQQLKIYRQSLLKWAFEGKLTNKNVKDGELPKGWKLEGLGSVLNKIEAGKSFKCDERTPKLDEVGLLKVSAVTWQIFNEIESKTVIGNEKINKNYFVKKHDFLFSRANTLDLIGAVVIVNSIERTLMLSDKTLRFQFNSGILPEYILYYLRSRKGRKEIQRLSTGNQESMRNIGQERIKQIEFPFCSKEEQQLIVDELESKLTVCDKIEETISQSLQQAETLRQSILKKAFEGKLVNFN